MLYVLLLTDVPFKNNTATTTSISEGGIDDNGLQPPILAILPDEDANIEAELNEQNNYCYQLTENEENELLMDHEVTEHENDTTPQAEQNESRNDENTTSENTEQAKNDGEINGEIDENDSDSDTGLLNLTQRTPPRHRNIDTQLTPTILNSGDADDMTDRPQNNNVSNTRYAKRPIHDIPTNTHASFLTLNSLKHKRNKTATTIEKLTDYQKDGTLPDGLNKTTDCNILLDDDLRTRWVKASRDAAKLQLDILIEQHQRTLTNIEQKIEHSTQRIQTKCNDQEQAQEILNATDIISKRYTSRHLQRIDKLTKRKRNTKRPNHGRKNNTPQNTTTRGLLRTPTQQSSRPVYTTQQGATPPYRLMQQQPLPFRQQPFPLTNNTTIINPITNHIQQQIQDFLTPAHLQSYHQHRRKHNKQK